MFGSVVLEVALGLVFTYAWFSLACSAIVEFVESFRAQRSKQLATAIERMLGSELKERFYQHGVVRSLSKSGRLPSYLPARSFALVTLDLLGVGAAQFRQQRDALSGQVAETLRTVTQGTSSYEEFVSRLECWFEDSMDRCSGWFRRRARVAAITTAFVLAGLLNVDSLEIASAIYSDTHFRLSAFSQADAEGQVPAVRRLGSAGVSRRPVDSGPTIVSIPIESGALPLGWENSRFVARVEWAENPWSRPSFWFGPVLMKVLGLLVTALAGSMGAVFWFDALRRVVAIRTSLVPGCRPVTRSYLSEFAPAAPDTPNVNSSPATLTSDWMQRTLVDSEEATGPRAEPRTGEATAPLDVDPILNVGPPEPRRDD